MALLSRAASLLARSRHRDVRLETNECEELGCYRLVDFVERIPDDAGPDLEPVAVSDEPMALSGAAIGGWDAAADKKEPA